MSPLENDQVYRKKDIPWRIIEGEAIVVEVDRDEIIHLNETGAEIWNVVDGKTTVSEIIEHICGVFEVSEEVAERDTLQFLGQLIDMGIVE
jgi:hypothetical protein